MTTNIQDARPTNRTDQPVGNTPTPKPTPVVNPTGVSGVAVYDQGPDRPADPSTVHAVSSIYEPAPVKTSSTVSTMAWIIGIIVMIIIAYFILQMLF